MSFVKSFLQDEQGQDLVEYCLLLAFVGLAAVGALTSVQGSIDKIWKTVNKGLKSANDAAKQ